ncbi:Arm DNA-binding domain-containing protein [Rhodopseudomonas palustris]|uniref:Arm DNA-binding domain-containing protein n=1 Tax=Rhodopseudomonas palustris TaxID=1076 RepID=UPI003B847186
MRLKRQSGAQIRTGISDGRGLALQIETSGSKLWRFRYRFTGKETDLIRGLPGRAGNGCLIALGRGARCARDRRGPRALARAR